MILNLFIIPVHDSSMKGRLCEAKVIKTLPVNTEVLCKVACLLNNTWWGWDGITRHQRSNTTSLLS